jgi:tetratricopeptide (TPR) repeat protein
MKKLLPFLVLLLLFHHLSLSQDQKKIDSLENELKKFEAHKKEMGGSIITLMDSTKANILNSICEEYWMNSPEKGMAYSKQLLELSEQIGFKKGVANAYNSMGVIYFYKANYPLALDNHKTALKIAEKSDYKQGIALSLICIGNVYQFQGNPNEALKNYLASLKISEAAGDQKYVSFCYNDIGVIYHHQKNYSEALKNFTACLQINKESGYKFGIASAYGNIGMIYQEEENLPEALKNYFACLTIHQEIKNKDGIALCLGNIGYIYYRLGNYSQSLKNQYAALKIYEEIGDKGGLAFCYSNIGNVFSKQNKNQEAALYLNKSLSVAKEIGNLESIKDSYYSLAALDSSRGNYRESLEHYKNFIAARDSSFNEANTKKMVQQQMQYDFEKKESLTKSEQEKKDAIALKELQKQKVIKYSGFAGLFVVLLFAFGLYKRFSEKRKANVVLENTLQNLKETQTQLIKSEKMAAFGVMAQRVAHEIQNPLNFVNNFSELAQEAVTDVIKSQSEEDQKQHADLLIVNLQKINEHGKRAAGIVKQLQDHSTKGTAQEFFET